MAWDEIEVQVNGETFAGHKQGTTFSVPFASGVEVGSNLIAAGKTHEAKTVENWAGRDEILIVETKEVSNDKPKARGNASGTGGKEV